MSSNNDIIKILNTSIQTVSNRISLYSENPLSDFTIQSRLNLMPVPGFCIRSGLKIP